MSEPARKYDAVPAVRTEEPLAVGMIGPPGGGKTFSALLLARGMQRVRGGDIIVIDTEAGRARKYADQFKFLHVEFDPPHRSDYFLDAIQAQIVRKPAAIVVDSMSDEHESIGGYLDWHDEMVPKMGGNDWAAWAKPKAARKKLIIGLLHCKTPLIFTFRAREKTAQKRNEEKNKNEVVNIGWMPVAPLEIVHAMDLTCILPPRANGKPVWSSEKIGEDFIVKLPDYLARLFDQGAALDERVGEALARWARGEFQQSAAEWEDRLTDAAKKGNAALHECWKRVPTEHRPALKETVRRLAASNQELPREAASGTAREAPSTGSGTADASQDVGTQSASPNNSETPPATPPTASVDTAPGKDPASGAAETRVAGHQQQPPSGAGSDDKIAVARQRGRDDKARGVKRSATPTEYRAPDRTSEAFAWVEGWNEVKQ